MINYCNLLGLALITMLFSITSNKDMSIYLFCSSLCIMTALICKTIVENGGK